MKFTIYKFLLLVIATLSLSLQISQADNIGNSFTIKASQNNISSDISYSSEAGPVKIAAGKSAGAVTSNNDPSISSTNNSLSVALSKSIRLNKIPKLGFSLLGMNFTTSRIFVNYGVFYDHINYTNYANSKYNISINSRYGLNAALGYDITNRFSIYSGLGYASVDYEIDSRSGLLPSNGTANNREISPIMNIGFNYNILKDLLLGLEYSRQELDLQTQIYAEANTLERYRFDTQIETFSLNLSKRF